MTKVFSQSVGEAERPKVEVEFLHRPQLPFTSKPLTRSQPTDLVGERDEEN
jgi:hypothetical protein